MVKHIIEIETTEPLRETWKTYLLVSVSNALENLDQIESRITVRMNNEPSALQASHQDLVKALEEARSYLADYSRREMWGTDGDDDVKGAQCIIAFALADAAKLAPTRTGGSGCER